MTTWGYILLAGFLTLGLAQSLSRRRAERLVLVLVAFVMGIVFVSYGAVR